MFRHFLALALATSAAAAPGPKARPHYYFPTTPGDKLVYALRDDDKHTEITETVEKAEAKDGGIIVTMKRTPPSDQTRKVLVTETSVQVLSENGKDHDPPITLLKLPATTGDGWDSTPKAVKLGTVTGHKSRVKGEEEIAVPAGKFRAIKVDSVIYLSGERYTLSQWYTPGLGLVKKQRARDGEEELKSFTTGK
jgi:hypothetical protein